MTALLLAALAAFAIGSIPFGIVVGRLFFNSDIRASGSGNIGAANALRTYGKTGGAAVLLLDGLKGFVPTWYANHTFGSNVAALVAVAAVLGHCYSPWLGFRGGKGVATWLGVLFAFSGVAGAIFVGAWLALVLPTRFSSLGSLGATLCAAVWVALTYRDAWIWTAVSLVTVVIFLKHRENIERLVHGREHKIGFSRRKDAGPAGLNTGPT